MQTWLANRSTGLLGDRARENAKALAALPPMEWRARVEHVQVMCAANTIAMVLLVGIVILQVRLFRPQSDTSQREEAPGAPT